MFKIKKDIFSLFGYLAHKSIQVSGRPVRERDLVLSSDDSYLLSYLEGEGKGIYNIVNALAQLSAYQEMGFSEVKFHRVDECPLCKVFDGS